MMRNRIVSLCRESELCQSMTIPTPTPSGVVENWVVWRDAGDWERFATVWHADGWMTATWFQGPGQRFIEVSREGFERGVNILHALGGFTCDIVGTRAISQAKMTSSSAPPSMA